MGEIYTLNEKSESVRHLIRKDKRLARVISMVGTITYSLYDDGYAFLVHEIIEQMLSIKAGKQIYDRLLLLCNNKISPQAILSLTDDELKSIGTSNAKVQYIKALTSAVSSGNLLLDDLNIKTDAEVMKELMSIRGIGTWTSKMYLIFVLNRENVLPYEDGAFIQSYKWLYKTDVIDRETVKRKCKKWSPYSSIAARYMYKALDLGLTKQEFHLFRG